MELQTNVEVQIHVLQSLVDPLHPLIMTNEEGCMDSELEATIATSESFQVLLVPASSPFKILV